MSANELLDIININSKLLQYDTKLVVLKKRYNIDFEYYNKFCNFAFLINHHNHHSDEIVEQFEKAFKNPKTIDQAYLYCSFYLNLCNNKNYLKFFKDNFEYLLQNEKSISLYFQIFSYYIKNFIESFSYDHYAPHLDLEEYFPLVIDYRQQFFEKYSQQILDFCSKQYIMSVVCFVLFQDFFDDNHFSFFLKRLKKSKKSINDNVKAYLNSSYVTNFPTKYLNEFNSFFIQNERK